jgi:hypothetical protein
MTTARTQPLHSIGRDGLDGLPGVALPGRVDTERLVAEAQLAVSTAIGVF